MLHVPHLPTGYSGPVRIFYLSAYHPDGQPLAKDNPLPASLAVLLNDGDLSIVDENPYRMVIQSYDEAASSWKLTPFTLDFPWLRTHVALSAPGLYATTAIKKEEYARLLHDPRDEANVE